MSDALHMAKDALEGYLLWLEDEKEAFPPASNMMKFLLLREIC